MKKRILLLVVLLFGGSLVAQGAGHYTVLTWTPSIDGAANPSLAYNVYRGTTAGGESSTALNSSPVAAACTNLTTCTYTDTAVTVGAKYFYTVKATLGGNLSVASNECSATTPIAAPTGVTASGSG